MERDILLNDKYHFFNKLPFLTEANHGLMNTIKNQKNIWLLKGIFLL